MYDYNREDMHQALLAHAKSGYDELHYQFYPASVQEVRLDKVVDNFNNAGFHVHAFECVKGGYDLWISRQYCSNRWGDREVNHEYRQQELPVFHEYVS